jgi:hypothetical protein
MGTPDQQCQALKALPVQMHAEGALYDERWVQLLIHDHPTVLPVGQIEPALVPLESVCMELPLPSGGYVDNLLLTRDGGIVVVETKLWRNPEARRAVVGQVLDYAKELSRLGYRDLERAVGVATKSPTLRLYDHVCGPDAAAENEAAFIDAVSRNLRLGRFLALIVGDGIQEGVEQLTEFLQRHIGLHFTLALVELSLWRMPDGHQVLVQPRILANTVQIERAVIRIDSGAGGDARVRVEPVAATATQRATVTTEQFYESLGAVDGSLPDSLKTFISDLDKQLGVYAEQKVMLTLKWRSPEGREFNLGVIDAQGRLFTDQTHSMAAAIGRLDANQSYKKALAAIIPGARTENAPDKAMGLRLVIPNQTGVLRSLLDHSSDWSKVIADYIAALESGEAA